MRTQEGPPTNHVGLRLFRWCMQFCVKGVNWGHDDRSRTYPVAGGGGASAGRGLQEPLQHPAGSYCDVPFSVCTNFDPVRFHLPIAAKPDCETHGSSVTHQGSTSQRESLLSTATYSLVSFSRRLLSRPDATILWTKVVIVVACLCGFALSHKLWVATRFFPLVPLVPGLPHIPFPLDYAYFLALIVVLILIASSSKPKILIFVFVTLMLMLGLLDQSRWQPWAYQYLFMLAALGFASSSNGEQQGQDDALNMCRLKHFHSPCIPYPPWRKNARAS